MVSGREIGPSAECVLADWSVPRQADAVPDARRQVREIAEKVCGLGERADDLELCISEVLGNAVRHGAGDQVRIFVYATNDSFVVSVTDEGSGGVPILATDAGESGRGLMLLDYLADGWWHFVRPVTGNLDVGFSFDLGRGFCSI